MIRMFAAIDVGAYEMELGIYEMSEKIGVRSVDHIRHVISIREDAYNNGKISHSLVEEMCEVLKDFTRIMKGYQVEGYRAYADTALREARNSQIVLDQIRVRSGIDIRVISNSEQRFINYKAIAAKDAEFQKTIQQGTAIVHAGFGSTQISLFDKDSLISTQNLPLGVLRLRTFMSQVRASSEVEQRMIREIVDNELVTFRKIYLKDREIKNLIAVGDPILAIFSQMEKQGHGNHISVEDFNRFYEAVCRMTPDQIEARFDVNTETAANLFPAAAIFKRVLEITGAEFLWVPGIRLTDGIAVEYAEEKKLLKFNHNFDSDIIATSRSMARRYRCHMPHIQAVETAALLVFDSLKKYHGLGARERLLLQIAADLHSCGKFVTMRDATICAYNIIMGTEIIGLSHVEREIVANVVRYHIQKFRYDEVKIEESAARDTRLATPDNINMVIAKLTAILRLANSMDRGHKNKLADCRVAVKNQELVITTGYSGDVTLEAISIAQKADFFEEIFGLRPVLKQKKKV